MQRLTVSLPDDVRNEVCRAAAAERRPMSNFVSGLIADAMLQRAPLAPELETFVGEISVALGPEVGAGFKRAFLALDMQGDEVPDADAFLRAAAWIGAHRSRGVMERIEMLMRVRHAARGQPIHLPSFTGWGA